MHRLIVYNNEYSNYLYKAVAEEAQMGLFS